MIDDPPPTDHPLLALCATLRCFDRETDSQRLMPKALRRQLEATLALVDAA